MKKTLILFFSLFLNLFTFAHVELLYPIGNESFTPGETINIEWKILIPHNTLNFDLSFSSDGGANWQELAFDLSAGTLNYHWLVPWLNTTEARIRLIQDNDGQNYGDISANFTISDLTSTNDQIISNKIKAFPNPFSDYILFEMENFASDIYELNIFTPQGMLMRKISGLKGETIRIESLNLQSGLYFYCLSNQKNIQIKGSLIAR